MVTQPLITVLIRTHGTRNHLNAVDSVLYQGYDPCKIVVHRDEEIRTDYSYNLICNTLKDGVTDGWFMFLDSDDTMIPGALHKIAKHLTNPDLAVICQFLRNGRPKPSDQQIRRREIKRGHIGMPCIFLHAKHKDIATFANSEYADYRFIKDVADRILVKFVQVAVVDSPKRNYGL